MDGKTGANRLERLIKRRCQDTRTNKDAVDGFLEGKSLALEAPAQTRRELFRKPLGRHKRHKLF